MEENTRSKNKSCIVVIGIFIIVFIVMGIYIGYLRKTVEEKKLSQNETEVIESNQVENINQEIEMSQEDEQIKKLLNKIDFPTYATASIYQTGDFNLDTIPNDLILRLGWAQIKDEEKETSQDFSKQTVTTQTMKESIEEIFGPDVPYTNEDFTNIDVETFNGYEENIGKIKYANNQYIADYLEGGGGDVPFIHQEVYKASKVGEKIKLYVKTAFIDTKYQESRDDFDDIIYKDFSKDKFENKLLETTAEEFSISDYDHSITLKPHAVIQNIVEELNCYVYTFEFNPTTKDYYLVNFAQEK